MGMNSHCVIWTGVKEYIDMPEDIEDDIDNEEFLFEGNNIEKVFCGEGLDNYYGIILLDHSDFRSIAEIDFTKMSNLSNKATKVMKKFLKTLNLDTPVGTYCHTYYF